ncbi:MAG: ATP-binding protein [Rhodospirillales bacterium]|nr:ATP-binding protein [Rhodospirillales bacterium]
MLIFISCVIAVAVFLFDILLPLGVAGGVPYVALVLVGLWFRQAKAIFYLALVGSFLTLLGYFISQELGIPWMVMTNRALAFFAIWVSAALAYQSKQRELDLIEAGRDLERKVAKRTAELTKEMDERKQAEEKARQLQDDLARICRMSEVVETTTVFAHELNQPLSVISGYAQGIISKLDDSGGDYKKILKAAEKIHEQAERASLIIRNTRGMLKNEQSARAPVDINDFTNDVVRLFESELTQNHIKITTELGENLPEIIAVPVQIQQVLINLIRNGIEACPLNGKNDHKITLKTITDHDGMIEIMVEDTGCGVNEEAARNLFNPFYSTKVEGLGMGLSISRSIIESHGGNLWHETPKSGGSRFHLKLPIKGEE